jgi:oligopeptidase B
MKEKNSIPTPWNRLLKAVVILLVLVGMQCSPKPPAAEKINKPLSIHGHTRIDPYYWLQERENPKVLEYLNAEIAYTDEMVKRTGIGGLQGKLYSEITGRLKQDDSSAPYFMNGYYYYKRFEAGKEYPLYCRKKGSLDEKEEIFLDVNEMAKGHGYYHVSNVFISKGNDLAAFGVDTVSRRKYTIHFKNLSSGELLDDAIPNTTGEPAWADDNRTIFYTIKAENLRPYKVMRHRIGDPTAADKEIFHEKDITFNTLVYRSKSQKYIMIRSYSTLSSEYRFLDAARPDGTFTLFSSREQDLEYWVEHLGNKFYIRTNWLAKNFRLMETPVSSTGKENWVEVVPHSEDIFLAGFTAFKHFLVLITRAEGLIHPVIIKLANLEEHSIAFDEETYTVYIPFDPEDGSGYTDLNPDTNTDVLRFTYTSLTMPESVYDYNMETHTRTLVKQEEVAGGFDPGNYHAERRFAEVRDRTRVPISIVYRRGLQLNGNNPMLLEAYGSYGSNMDPEFRPELLSLLDRGFVYAIAHVRGGQEMGRYWYEEGKLLEKKNTFTDFIDCALYLIDEKFTHPQKLFALGGSAGGLLMGAVTNMRPDLFKGIIAEVPWTDVVTCMLDDTVPLTSSEWDEWGNPINKEYYDYMLSYSPYDNVEAKDYPAMMVTTGFQDSQVQYWDPAKWVAKLRDKKTDDNLLLFSINMEAGHSGASGRFEKYKEIALEYAFMLHLIGFK